jgi:LysM repeat protein
MKPSQTERKQAAGGQSHFARGLGSLANGLVAVILVGLTLLVAIVLAMGERDLVASKVPTATATATATVPLPTATVSVPTATPSRTPSSTPSPVPLTPSALPSPSPSPSFTPSPRPQSSVVTYCLVPSNWRSYIVQRGESLSSLARRFSISQSTLMRANCLTSVTLYIGQRLYVPNVLARQTCGKPSGWVAYTVRPGDTLYRLALRYGTTVARLKLANCLTRDTIYIGERLWVPYPSVYGNSIMVPPELVGESPMPTIDARIRLLSVAAATLLVLLLAIVRLATTLGGIHILPVRRQRYVTHEPPEAE